MKRYFVFAYMMYYPSGGMDDFMGAYDDLAEAKERAKECCENDYVEVWDMETHTKVYGLKTGLYGD